MKLQALAVIAAIIILPMTIILTKYSQNQIKTLQMQIQYDSKLKNATYDAIKAFQLNMSNSNTSDLANSKMRDIKASIETFYNSLSSHFNMSGYGKNVLQNYVPAIVYTLYDGYYIYSAYDNTLDKDDTFVTNATYKDFSETNERTFGLKPYIYYSCRYVKSNPNIDVVITYSLDSYITIQGTIDNKSVNESGYLLTGVGKKPTGDVYTYNGIEIEKREDSLNQKVYVEGDTTGTGETITLEDTVAGSIQTYPCKKVNGVRYYQENENDVFSIINDKKYPQNTSTSNKINVKYNYNAEQFYKDAYEFKQKILSESGDLKALKDLTVSDAVDTNGEKYKENNPYSGNEDINIFKELDNSTTQIEDPNSNFNAHRLQVIKNSIETNLVPAIANYNKISTSDVNFQMPRLNDEEWEQIMRKCIYDNFPSRPKYRRKNL